MYFRSGGRDERERYMYAFLTVEQYLKKKCSGESISKVFTDNNYKSVAIYGTDELGVCLYQDLMNSDVKADCFIESDNSRFTGREFNIPVISVDEIMEKCHAEVIVISSVYSCNEIIDLLLKNGWALENIMSLSDVVY